MTVTGVEVVLGKQLASGQGRRPQVRCSVRRIPPESGGIPRNLGPKMMPRNAKKCPTSRYLCGRLSMKYRFAHLSKHHRSNVGSLTAGDGRVPTGVAT